MITDYTFYRVFRFVSELRAAVFVGLLFCFVKVLVFRSSAFIGDFQALCPKKALRRPKKNVIHRRRKPFC